MIHLACTQGNIGYWSFYSTVMKIKDIVSNNRIITVGESEELYTKNINEILQREISESRIKSICDYINNNEERFFSSLIVAIHKGDPKWTEIDISKEFEVEGSEIDDDTVYFLSSKFGVLTLKGNEEIFALDGQHRLKGLRKAFKADNNIGDLEIPITFVIHNHIKKDKTRRLFTVLNKYAEKPKQAELIILEEDDVAAINTRKLVTEHPVLSQKNAISNSKTGSISNNDYKSFTTLVTVYKINRILYNQKSDFYRKRPSEEDIKKFYEISTSFWNLIFVIFPEIEKYIKGERNIFILNSLFDRNVVTGGSLLLRPMGQELLANVFSHLDKKGKKEVFINNIRKIDFNLSGKIYNLLFWNDGKIISKNIKLKNNLTLYLLNEYLKEDEIKEEMTKLYKTYNVEYIHLKPVL
jgi:DNA sulfur modification protein DndB